VVILVIALLTGVNPSDLTGGAPLGSGPVGPGGSGGSGSEEFAHCSADGAANEYVDCRIIGTAESLDAVWAQVLPTVGVEYAPPGVVLFQDAVSTGCGEATSEVGPFYCPPDAATYVDTSFFQVLTDRFGASGGPLAQEYVVAHEFGHHISNQLGLLGRAQQDPAGPESGAVRSELQADCFAGVWAHHATTTPDPDTGRVDPEGWTHGSSEQRQRWFTIGYRDGRVGSCDTFAAAQL